MLLYFNGFCGGLLIMLVVAVVVAVVLFCVFFFAIGYGCHGGGEVLLYFNKLFILF